MSSLTRGTRIALLVVDLCRRLPGVPARDMPLRLASGGEVYARTDTLDIDLETLNYSLEGTYFPVAAQDRVVLDLGAHKGYFAIYCLERGARAVISLEPESDNYRCLTAARPRRGIGGRWVREPVAVGAEAGTATLRVSSESWSHSLAIPPSGDVIAHQTVEVVAFGALLTRVGLEHPRSEVVVKLNVEGMAADCILSVDREAFEAVHELIVDVEATTPQSVEQLVDHLGDAGFVVRSERHGVWHFVRPGQEDVGDSGVPTATGSRSPDVGRVRFGDLRRTSPLDPDFGFGRGLPIDRYYIEGFLGRHRGDIRGRVLEIGDPTYTHRFGGSNVEQADVLHVDPAAEGATFVGDLADGSFLPSSTYDAVLLTQTLHLIFDFPSALRTVDRILRPGGTLLLTVPGITPVDRGEWASVWSYSFTEHAVARMVEAYLTADTVEIRSYGNALAAIGFLHGLSAVEFTTAELDVTLPTHAVVHAARITRAIDA